MEGVTTIHHSHTPDINIQSSDKATGIWAMEDMLYWMQGGEEHWLHGFGFYHETYEKRNGKWVFTNRRLKRISVKTSPGAVFPPKRGAAKK
ncbi:MAG: nuclear transport factor 2 family protein [Rhodospirillaceae bacterium]|nr:MAG: nuclear transport factor 2 family protein [Rhodospirillaceae bacterium]